MGESYYEILEVDADATREEIQAAYRERVLETHPDHNDAPDAAEQFKRVSTARSVLADGTERARYDRLGHEAYARLADRTAAADESGTDDSSEQGRATDSSDDANDRTTGSKYDRETAGSSTTGSKTASSSATDSSTAGSRRNERSKSHHARQRRRRQRARKHARTTHSFGGETGPTGNHTGTTATTTGDRDDSASEFRYAVHDWTDDVTLEWEGESITHTTAVTIGCLWLLYPVFVGASLTSAFPLAVNVVVAACTLGLVGYVLTKPRIAAALFGSWSVLFPLGIDATAALEAYSISGLLALGFAWIPFGYAIVLWWALRP
ncbi:J domain-containing protein [Haloterrigena alkaliphila]|uniref:DnaJ domain-containing protein n=1 Tax=Haloterrigena alkaliphila TaxID=2816475 RepID=A0A8A2VET6_9EURY|nr:DnaJ domain-containing protein [Haloterrigena alkaliphila]QSW98805.1 DnaJ domain-containing protein [Haloterrigena alkaliphila]